MHMPEAWKIMIGVTVLLIVFGVFVSLGLREPAEVAGAILVGSFFVITVYIGFRIGRRMEFGEDD